MRALLLSLILAAPLPALADCAPGSTVFSCRIGGKVLELCQQGASLTYAFGPPGAPELVLSEPLLTVDYQPWPGVGSAVWESVTFRNGNHGYEVWTRSDRNFRGLEAGIEVSRGGARLASLGCDPGSASGPLYDRLFPLKEAAGLCWHGAAGGWSTDC